LIHQTQKIKKMKSATILLAAVLTLSLNVVFARTGGTAMISETSSSRISIAPVTPVEATFEEMTDATATFTLLAPVTPAEADFSDAIPETTIDIAALAPVTPGEAEFGLDDVVANANALDPITPSVADFSDGI